MLELNPGCIQALLALATMELAVGASATATQHGSRLLAQAFQSDPHNPYTLALLAHFSLQQGLAPTALKLAIAAKERVEPDDPALQAEVNGLLGRAHHAIGALDKARKCYDEALSIDSGHPTAGFGLAQLQIKHRNYKGAAKSLERLVEHRPTWVDPLRLLAPLCSRVYPSSAAASGTGATSSSTTAIPTAPLFKEAAEREGKDAELWEMLGDVTAGSDPATALAAYKKAIALHSASLAPKPTPPSTTTTTKENGHPTTHIPARLLNNAAVLQLRSGNAGAALESITQALTSAVSLSAQGGDASLQQGAAAEMAQVTLGYNAARIREAVGDTKAAEKEYEAIIAQFPAYADCYLRLACIAKSRGDVNGAEAWAQKGAQLSGNALDSLALLAQLYLSRRDLEAAKKILDEFKMDKMKQGGDRMRAETYARVALGNVHLYSAKGDVSHQDIRKNMEHKLSHAIQQYGLALDRDPGNIFAANGVGCVLAECGRLSEAKDVFLWVQEGAAGSDGFVSIPDAWINLAAVYSAMGDFSAAEQTYLNSMRRFPEVRDDARVQLYLAKAQYDGGRLERSLRTLCKIAHLAPRDHRLRFNVAYLQQHIALRSIEQVQHEMVTAADEQHIVVLQRAMARINSAAEGFLALDRQGQNVTGIRTARLSSHITFVLNLSKQAETLMGQTQQAVQQAAILMEANRKKMELEAHKRKLEERKKEVEQEAMERAREAQAKEASAKMERLKSEWKQGAALAKAAAKGDASAVARSRELAQRKQDAENAAMEALFADDGEEDDEYQPGMNEGEEEDGGGGEGNAVEEEEEAEFEVEDDDDEDFNVMDVDGEKGEKKKKTKKTKAKKDGGEEKAKQKREKRKKKEGEEGTEKRLLKKMKGDEGGVEPQGLEVSVVEGGGGDGGGGSGKGEMTLKDLFGSGSDDDDDDEDFDVGKEAKGEGEEGGE